MTEYQLDEDRPNESGMDQYMDWYFSDEQQLNRINEDLRIQSNFNLQRIFYD